MPSTGEITRLLSELTAGNRGVNSKLMALVYGELRRLAASYMRSERPNHTLQPTALVNEVYIRLSRQEKTRFRNKGHFFAIAAQAMRRVLLDHARSRNAGKRGVWRQLVSLDEVAGLSVGRPEELIAVDVALSRLAEQDPRQARIVELRYFAGMTEEETAVTLGVSAKTVKRDWSMARAWLHRELSKDEPDAS